MYEINGEICWNARGAAALFGIGRNSMLKKLRQEGYLNQLNIPPTQMIYDGYFKVKRGSYGGAQFETLATYFTKKGLDLIKEVCKDLPKKKKKVDKTLYEEIPLSDDLNINLCLF